MKPSTIGVVAALLFAACGEPAEPDAGFDAGARPDAEIPDTGVVDTGVVIDTGVPDAGPEEVCGDGVRRDPELCDGDTVECASLGAHWTGGSAPCRARCDGYDTSACAAADGREWELIKPAERDARWELARCNDGTPFDVLYRPGAAGSETWVIWLQGGGWGDDVAFPTAERAPQLTSTTALPDRSRAPLPMLEHGIFGPEAFNPDFDDAHMVLAHYCSSDLWSGRGADRRPVAGVDEGFYFAGRHNVRAAFEVLKQRYGLDDGSPGLRVLYGGESAGNVGSAQNANTARELLPNAAADGRLRYYGDGAWLVAHPEPELRWGASPVGDVELFERAIAYWDAEPLPSCPSAQRGECYLGRGWYPGVRALGLPVVVGMSVHDEVVLGLRGVCTEGCGPAGRVCFEGCTSLDAIGYATIRQRYRDDWEAAGVEWLFAWGSTEHTGALVDQRWNGPPGATEPMRQVVGDFFFDRTAPRRTFVNGADR